MKSAVGMLLIAASLASAAPVAGAPISLAGPWKIALGDDPAFAFPAFGDGAWDTVELPASVMPYVWRKTRRNSGVLWLRKTVRIDAGAAREDMGLILGRIGAADETFFNGERIGGLGSFPPRGHSMWAHPRRYTVPRAFVRYGADNVVAVRLHYYIFGEVLGRMSLAPDRDRTAARSVEEFLLIDAGYLIIAMGLTLLLISLLVFIMRPGLQEHLFNVFQLVCGLVMVLEVCAHWNIYGSMLNRFRVLGLGWAAVNVAHPIFLHRLYGLQRKKIEMALWIYLATVAVIAIFFIDERLLRAQGIAMILVTWLIGPYNISCHITALRLRRPHAKLFSAFGIIVVLGAIHDGIAYFMRFAGLDLRALGGAFQFMVFHYTAAGLFAAASMVLVTRFIRAMEEVEDLNTSLEGFVIENALLNERLREAPGPAKREQAGALSGRTEEKIRRVVDYIRENFTFDLSREGLAATVDVHPDNLGKLFKLHTNRKLGDYINELRIREAAKRLVETDESIITIAFSVGFDTLRTFNRAFPRFMGVTPEKYRKAHRSPAPPID